jgi:hypothetical protein
MLLVFDVLALSGTDLRDRPLVERRQALERLIAALHPCLQLVSHAGDIAFADRGSGGQACRWPLRAWSARLCQGCAQAKPHSSRRCNSFAVKV